MKKTLLILILINLFILPSIILGSNGTIPVLPVFRVVSDVIQPRDQDWIFSIGGSSTQVGEVRWLELSGNGTNYVGFEAPDSISSNLIWKLPATDSTGTQYLASDGSETLSWGTPAGGSGDITSVGSATSGAVFADGGSGGNLYFQDDDYIYFDTAKTRGLKFSTPHDDPVWTTTYPLTTEGDLYIVSNSGATATGTWEPTMHFSSDGYVTISNTSQGGEGNKFFYVYMPDGMRFNSGGGNSAWLLADNVTTTDKTFQFPNFPGTLIGTGNLADITTVGTVGTGTWAATAIGDTYIASSTAYLATLTEEEVEDFVGGMLGGTETHIAVTYQDASNNIDFVVDDSFIKLVGDTTGALTEDLNIDANTLVVSYDDNKVGIGTVTPNAPLEVKGAKPGGNVGGFQSGMFHITGAGTAEFSNSVITGHSAYATNTQLWYLGSTSSGNDGIGLLNRQDGDIQFYTNNAFKMIIEAAGDVGIGVTDPDTKLEVFNAGNQLKLSFDGTDNAIFAVDTSGDLTITPSGTQIIVSGNISATNLSGTNTGDNDEVGTLTNGDLCVNDGSDVQCTVNTIAELETALDATNVIISTEIDSFSELDSLVSDKALINLADGGTFTGNIIANANLSIGNATTTAGVLTLLEDDDDGSNFASFMVPALVANTVYTLPTAVGGAGEQLTDAAGNGVLSWAAAGGAGAIAWDDITAPDANDEIDFAAYVIELNVENFQIGDGGANYVDFDGTPTITFAGNADIDLPNDSVDDADINWGELTDLVAGGEVSWGNIAAGELANDSIIDADIDDDGNFAFTGRWDFGGGDLEIPQGAAVTDPSEAGEIAIDTTSDQFLYYGGAQRVLSYQKEFCYPFEDPVDADDDIPFYFPRQAITITDVYCQVDGGTSIAMVISDGTNALESITCDGDGAEDDGSIANGSFTSLERMEFDLDAASGTNTWLNICVTYIIDAD